MKYQIIRDVTRCDEFEGDAEGFEEFAKGLGLTVTGRTSDDLTLPQRRNQPILDGFPEPFGNSDGLRYEDWKSYEAYSS